MSQPTGKSKITTFTDREKVFAIDPFGYRLHVVVSENTRQSFELRRDVLKTHLNPKSNMVALTFTMSGSMDIWVFYPEQANVGTTAHEIVHVVSFLMREIGAEFEEEIWAYYIDGLTQSVSEFIHEPWEWLRVKKRRKTNGIQSGR